MQTEFNKSSNDNILTHCYETNEKMQLAGNTENFAAMINIPDKSEGWEKAVPFKIYLSTDLVGKLEDKDVRFKGNGGQPNNDTKTKWVERSHFVQAQHLVQQSILKYLGVQTGLSTYIQEAPYYSYTTDPPRWLYLALPLTLLLIPSVPFAWSITLEKKKNLHEHVCNSNGVSVVTLGLGRFLYGIVTIPWYGIVSSVVIYLKVERVGFPVLALLVLLGLVATCSFVMLLASLVKHPFGSTMLVFFGTFLSAAPTFLIPEFEDPFGWLCLLFPISTVTKGFNHIEFYDKGLGLPQLTFGNLNAAQLTPNAGECMLVLIAQTVVYLALALYCMMTIGGNGTKRVPCCFCCMDAKQRKRSKDSGVQLQKLSASGDLGESLIPAAHAVSVGTPMIECNEGTMTKEVGIAIEGLRKVYGTDVKAVDGLTVDMYRGEITALLGHNGAGKTTTMQMLTGGVEPSGGDAFVLGNSIAHDMTAVREDVGICPQHNVLWDKLTVREHVQLFADLKAVDITDEDVLNVIKRCDLESKMDARSSALSGGMKRKLCVAMALIGKPRVLILDEPTAGLDPESRRVIWDMLQIEKEGKTVILCTHHMEEADLLGDRIVVMAHGKLQVAGSSLFLKQKFGIGYKLAIEVVGKNEALERLFARVTKLVEDQVPEAERSIADTGNENEIQFDLPMSSSPKFAALFAVLEREKAKAQIVDYGLTMPSLEEVFLRLADMDEKNVDPNDDNAIPLEKVHRGSDLVGHLSRTSFDRVISGSNLPVHREVASFSQQCKSLLRKRGWVGKRDKLTFALLIISPLLYFGMAAAYVYAKKFLEDLTTPKLGSRTFTMKKLGYGNEDWKTQDFPKQFNIFSNGRAPPEIYQAEAYQAYPESIKFDNLDIKTPPSQESYTGKSSFARDMLREYQKEKIPMYGGVQFGEHNISITYNTSFLESPPILVQWLGTAGLRSLPEYKNSHFEPTVETVKSKKAITGRVVSASIYGVLIAYFITLALLGAGIFGGVLFVKERQAGIKQAQDIAGMSSCAYFTTTLAVDIVVGAVLTIVLAILYAMLGDSSPPVSIVQWALFTGAAIPMTYNISRLTSTAEQLQTYVTSINGALLSLPSFVLTVLTAMETGETDSNVLKDVLTYAFYTVSPPSALATGLNQLIQNQVSCTFAKSRYKLTECTPETMKVYEKPWLPPSAWDGGGAMTWFFLFHFVVHLSLYFLLDSREKRRGAVPVDPVKETEDADEDVHRERLRLHSPTFDENAKENLVACKGVRKKYKGQSNYAVKDINFSVQSGSCFALLGPNGAGKSTTMNMLTGAVPLSGGEGYVGGRRVTSELPEIYKRLGYCPQHGGLVDGLTVGEHLQFFCELRGMGTQATDATASFLMNKLGLLDHKDKLGSELSGGNKRKLAMAVAMVGKPAALVLDEPTAGVDPAVRRDVVEVIHEIKNDSSIILTTHIMEEVEALANTVGIMVNGELRCVGSLQHLLSRFGGHYVMEIRSTVENWPSIRTFVEQTMPTAVLDSRHFGQSTWNLPKESITLSAAFGSIEKHKQQLGISSFSISQLSLEQLFLKFAKHQEQGVTDA